MDKLKTKVLVVQPIHEDGMRILNDNIGEVVVAPDHSPETILGLLDDKVEGVVVRYNVFNREMIEKAPNLKVIARHGIGVELIDLDAATGHRVIVVNTPAAATVSVAEHAVMMILVLAKRLYIGDAGLRAGDYAIKDRYQPCDVEGAVLGLVGMGKIGQEVARRCRGLDMKVRAFDPYANPKAAQEQGIELVDSLEEILKTSDFISLHTPLTLATEHMIGARQLAMMKPTAYLVNCSRGAVVDEAALIEALQKKVLAGAGLDVFEKEPPEADNPLFKMNNVVVTPHSSSLTQNGKVKMAIGAATQLVEVLRGENPSFVVNKDVLSK